MPILPFFAVAPIEVVILEVALEPGDSVAPTRR